MKSQSVQVYLAKLGIEFAYYLQKHEAKKKIIDKQEVSNAIVQ